MRKEGLSGVLLAAGIFSLTPCVLADWGPTKRLTWTSSWSLSPAVAVDSSGVVHLFWYDDNPGNYEIYRLKSTDGGTTWTHPRRLAWSLGWSRNPAAAIDSNDTIHVVWDDDTPGNYDICYRSSTDGGSTWSKVKRLTQTTGSSEYPAIAIDSNDTIHVVWQDNSSGNYEIYYRESEDGGVTWNAVQKLTWTSGPSSHPTIATDPNNSIHLVWQEYTPSITATFTIGYKRSTDGGVNWSAAQGLAWNAGISSYPSMAIYPSDNIHVVWQNNAPGKYEIYYRRSTDGGVTWTTVQRLTWTAGDTLFPAIAIDSNNSIFVVWGDNLSGNYEIYYRNSPDGGVSWGNFTRLTWTTQWSSEPAIAIDSGASIHVVWQDDTPGNYDIYYRKRSL